MLPHLIAYVSDHRVHPDKKIYGDEDRKPNFAYHISYVLHVKFYGTFTDNIIDGGPKRPVALKKSTCAL